LSDGEYSNGFTFLFVALISVHAFRVEDYTVRVVFPSAKENVVVAGQVAEFHVQNVGTNAIAQLTCRVCDRYKDRVVGDPLLKGESV
jgi:hypothetical protein